MKSNQKKLSESLLDFIKSNDKLSHTMQNFSIRELWKETFGDTVNNYTESIKMQNQVLIIKINSAPLKQELNFSKDQIVEKINASLPYKKINSVVIY